jgi:hypothetical protein
MAAERGGPCCLRSFLLSVLLSLSRLCVLFRCYFSFRLLLLHFPLQFIHTTNTYAPPQSPVLEQHADDAAPDEVLTLSSTVSHSK